MRINTNVAALNSYNQLSNTQDKLSQSLERLSSGKRINSAADDAAGLAISEKMKGQTRGLAQAQRNAQDGISMIQTAEGALKESHSILQRMRELSVQSANDTNTTDDRAEINNEIGELKSELNRIAQTTEFNTKKLLNGNLGGQVDTNTANSTLFGIQGVSDIETSGAKSGTYTISVSGTDLTMSNSAGTVTQTISDAGGEQNLTFDEFGITVETNPGYTAGDAAGDVAITAGAADLHVGANEGQNVQLSIGDMQTDGVLNVDGVDASSQSGANAAIGTIDNAIKAVSQERSKLGAKQNRLEHTINNLNIAEENITAAESRISDVDMAEEMMNMSKQQILSQAGTAMMAQANQLPQGVLQLLG